MAECSPSETVKLSPMMRTVSAIAAVRVRARVSLGVSDADKFDLHGHSAG